MCCTNLFSSFVFLNCCKILLVAYIWYVQKLETVFELFLLELFFIEVTWWLCIEEKKISSSSFKWFIFVTPSCRWKVHDDWVSQLKYYDSLRAVISCSNHPDTALVIGKLSYNLLWIMFSLLLDKIFAKTGKMILCIRLETRKRKLRVTVTIMVKAICDYAWFVHLENLNLNFSSLSFVIGINLLGSSPSSTLVCHRLSVWVYIFRDFAVKS